MNNIEHIIFFDGVCNLCNTSVQFFYKKNEKGNLYFSSLQSPFAKAFLPSTQASDRVFHTLFYYSEGVFYTKSEAAIKACQQLKSPFKYLSIIQWIPLFLRDWVYSIVSNYRFTFFGKAKNCLVPIEEQKHRFIESYEDYQSMLSSKKT